MVKKISRVLVTGGAGFIGSHLVEALFHAGYEIVVVDNLSHGDKKRIPPGVRLIITDIADPQLREIFQHVKPEVVFHLAAQQDVGTAQKNPLFDARVNILGTINVLESCRLSGVKKIIYADSVAGFGNPQKIPLVTNHPRQPISFYGISKHTVEHYLEAYSRYFHLTYVGLILANVYGPHQDPLGEGGVVAIFAHRMNKNKTIVIYGDGKQTRDFIYVTDVVNAFVEAIAYAENQFLMVGTELETSINQLYNYMKKITQYQKKPIYSMSRSGDVIQSVFNTSETKKILRWKPQYTIKKGLALTVTSF